MKTIEDVSTEKQMLSLIAMPADTNAAGKIFGGWLLSQMDLAASVVATRRTNCRVVTVAVNNMRFIAPVDVGDKVNFYAEVSKVGNTSVTTDIFVTVERPPYGAEEEAASGQYIYVAVDENGKPHPLES